MDRIHIQGYKSLADVTLDIKPINILIGGNGAGKSNFIRFFEFLRALVERRLQNYTEVQGGVERILYHGTHAVRGLMFTVFLGAKKETYDVELVKGTNGFVFDLEFFQRGTDKPVEISSSREAEIGRSSKLGAKGITQQLYDLQNYHFHDTGVDSPFTNLSHTENDTYYLYSNGSNIGAYLYQIQKTNQKAYNRIVKNIQSIAPFFLDFFLQPNEGKFIRLQWRDKYSEYVYGVNDLSDGTIRFIALSVLFLQPKLPKVLIIDEPELGLHPVAIIKLAGLIKIAAAKGCKVIVATQSPALVDQFAVEDIVTVDNEGGASRFRRLNEQQLKLWLEDYSLGELWERNVIENAQP